MLSFHTFFSHISLTTFHYAILLFEIVLYQTSFLLHIFSFMYIMGPILSRSIEHSANIRGNHNTVWFLNGAKFDVSSISNHSIQNAIERLEKTIITNNSSIIINLVLILATILIPIIFLQLRFHYRQSTTRTSFNDTPLNQCDHLPTFNKKSSSKDIFYYAGENFF